MAEFPSFVRAVPFGPDIAGPGFTLQWERGLGVAKLQTTGPGDDTRFSEIVGLPAPAVGRQLQSGALTFAWLAPGEWLVCGPEAEVANWTHRIEAQGAETVLAVDLTHARSAFVLAGAEARAVLSAHCPLDLWEMHFAVDDVARSLLGDTGAFIARLPDDAAGCRFRIVVDQTMGAYAARILAGARPRTGLSQ